MDIVIESAKKEVSGLAQARDLLQRKLKQAALEVAEDERLLEAAERRCVHK
jgi:hypothetical protein